MTDEPPGDARHRAAAPAARSPSPATPAEPLVLGIDTSCDDTGIGIVRGTRVLANAVASQTALHARFGGVVPERASREHLTAIDAVLDAALDEAGVGLGEIDRVAATYGPGLVGALLVGLGYGKALAWSLGVPFVPVHHLEGHIASSVVGPDDAAPLEPPFVCLIASGGHTSLFEVRGWGDLRELGRSRDDAAGEAFDKVARLLGLGYPGGPALAELAERGDPRAVDLPVPMAGHQGFDFSFSGIKTAVAVRLERDPDIGPADMAASFQRVVVASLVGTATRALEATGLSDLVVAGGVAANRELRRALAGSGARVRVPPLELATDNGAMIALAAALRSGGAAGEAADVWSRDAAPYAPLAEAPG